MKKAKTLAEFEATHGQPKMRRLSAALAAERAKVEALAGQADRVTIERQTDANTIRFAVLGDTQFGSLYSCPENMAAFYRAAVDRGVTTFLHSGDVLDGWKVYKGQEFELRDVGFDAQLSRFAAEAPSVSGTRTLFITGNHDLSYKNLVGAPVGKLLHDARPDWEHVGDESAVVEFQTVDGRPLRVGLYHMGGGTAYAVSYRPQKAVEQLEGGRKPHVAVFGHFHKAELLPAYRNVAILQSGCFQWQTPFMARMPSAAHVGGWIVEVQPGASYNAIRAEFVAFYRPQK